MTRCLRTPIAKAATVVGITILFGVLGTGMTHAQVTIQLANDKISAQVAAVPMMDVLAVIARETRSTVLVRGDVGSARPQSFTDAPLLSGLERLVAPNRLMIEFQPGSPQPSAIARIRIFGNGAAAERQVEPTSVRSAAGPVSSSKVQPTRQAKAVAERSSADVPGADSYVSPLGWEYEDETPLPPVATRIRKISGIYPTSGDEGLAALSGVLDADPDASARVAAVRAISGFQTDDAALLLEQAMIDDAASVRLTAIQAIASVAMEPSDALISAAVDDDEDTRVRLAALEALARFTNSEDARDAIADAAEASNHQVQEAAKRLSRR